MKKLLLAVLGGLALVLSSVAVHGQTATAVNATLSLNPVPLGVGTTVSVSVNCAPSCGLLQMHLNGTSIFGPGDLGANGNVSYNIPSAQLPSTGTYQLVLNYLGNATTAPSQSTLSINVVPNTNPAPNMTASLSVNPVPLGVGTTVTVNVPCTPCGTVQMILNGTSIFGPGGNGNASLYIPAWRLSSTGNYPLLIKYLGDANTAPTQITLNINVVPDTNPVPAISGGFVQNPLPLGATTNVFAHVDCASSCGPMQMYLGGTSIFGPVNMDSYGNANSYIAPFRLSAVGTYQFSLYYLGGGSTAPTQTTITLSVLDKTPSISWTPPASVPCGTALSATQLNATANVAGTFTYTPAIGSVLSCTGSPQTLSVSFSPQNNGFNTTTATVPITVLSPTPPTVTVTAIPDTVLPGGSVNVDVAVTCDGGTTCGVGSGSLVVNGQTYQFTLKADGDGQIGGDGKDVGLTVGISSTTAPGAYPLTVNYSGNASHPPASGLGTLYVLGPSTVSIKPAHDHLSIGDPLQVTVSESCNSACGTVNLLINGTFFSSYALGSNGFATIIAPSSLPLVPGQYIIEADYTGNTTYAASSGTTTVTVDQTQPVLSWTPPARSSPGPRFPLQS